MLRAAHRLLGYTVAAVDGKAGRLEDFLFDPGWRVLHAVVNLGAASVLLDPAVLGSFDEEKKTLGVGLNTEQVEGCLPLPSEAASRWAPEFATRNLAAAGSAPAPVDMAQENTAPEAGPAAGLRSTREVNGYAIQARDGAMGRLDDLILDDEDWLFRYLLVDTARWLPGKGLIVAVNWTSRIDWSHQSMHVDLTCEAIRRSPPFDPSKPVNREYERKLYEHYGRTYDRR